MKIENQTVTVKALKLGSFILGLISITWIISSKILNFQSSTDSRFERIEGKMDVFIQTTTNNFKFQDNKRKVDSASFKNDFKDLKSSFVDFTQEYRRNQMYGGRPLSSN